MALLQGFRRAWLFGGIFGLSLLASPVARAQFSDEFKIEKVTMEFPKTPSRAVNATTNKKSVIKEEQWLEIEVQYRAEPREPDGDYLDTVQVKIHLLTPPDKLDQKSEVFTIDLNYGPVKKGKELFAVAYLPPWVVEQYGGEQAFKAKSNAAAEIFSGGRPVGEAYEIDKKNGEPGWFTRGGKSGKLLPLSKTPWAMDYWDHFPPQLEVSR